MLGAPEAEVAASYQDLADAVASEVAKLRLRGDEMPVLTFKPDRCGWMNGWKGGWVGGLRGLARHPLTPSRVALRCAVVCCFACSAGTLPASM